MLTTHRATIVEIVINERKARGDLPFTHIGARFAEDYIIPSKCSFQTLSRENMCSRKIMARDQQNIYGDTMNTFGCEDQNF
jgi:hypothetical protein